jgi:hypothetical protein
VTRSRGTWSDLRNTELLPESERESLPSQLILTPAAQFSSQVHTERRRDDFCESYGAEQTIPWFVVQKEIRYMLCTGRGAFYNSAGAATSVLLRPLANSPVFPPAAIRLAMNPSSPTMQTRVSASPGLGLAPSDGVATAQRRGHERTRDERVQTEERRANGSTHR